MNQYTRVGSVYQSHDQAGNTLSSSELGLQRFFDAENRLVQWTQGAKDIRYRYDALGRRVLKQDTGSSFATTLYFYDGWHDVEEATTGGVVTRRYVYGENVDEPLRVTLADAADVNNNGNTTELIDLYYHQNSLGSVVALTTTAGAVAESYRYSAYGEPTIFDKTGAEVGATQVKQPFMFTGRRWDFEEEGGLYYYRLRYYDPASGRFVSRDPLGLWGDPGQRGNGQSYCGNNPVNRVDPFGDQDQYSDLRDYKPDENRYGPNDPEAPQPGTAPGPRPPSPPHPDSGIPAWEWPAHVGHWKDRWKARKDWEASKKRWEREAEERAKAEAEEARRIEAERAEAKRRVDEEEGEFESPWGPYPSTPDGVGDEWQDGLDFWVREYREEQGRGGRGVRPDGMSVREWADAMFARWVARRRRGGHGGLWGDGFTLGGTWVGKRLRPHCGWKMPGDPEAPGFPPNWSEPMDWEDIAKNPPAGSPPLPTPR